MKKILIYDDYRHNNNILIRRLSGINPSYQVGLCDAEDILNGRLDHTVALLVMPGGADLFYCERLDGAANALIKSYVEHGGSYLGICAGAYYGASNLQWAKDQGSKAICDTRELALIDTTAIGPLYSYTEDQNFEKSWDGVCAINYGGVKLNAVYRGGCRFEGPDGAKVLAYYDDLEHKVPAIVQGRFGDGRVVLSGPHIELRSEDYKKLLYKHQNPSYDYCRNIIEAVKPYDDLIQNMWEDIINSLL